MKEVLCLCFECREKRRFRDLRVVREWTGAPCDNCGNMGVYWVENNNQEPKLMIASKITELDNWEEPVLRPLSERTKHAMKQILNPLIVAWDTEDYGKERKTLKKGEGEIVWYERFCLGHTFAVINSNGEIQTNKWDIERKVTWEELEAHVREWLKVPNDQIIYLLTHLAFAELRHVSNWKDIVKERRGKILIIHEDTVHIRTDTMNVIDTFAFFNKGLKTVAKFVGMEKKMQSPEGKPYEHWIVQMNELKKKYPAVFWEYALNDAEILVKAFHALRNLLWNKFEIEILPRGTRSFPLATVASIGLYIFRRDYLKVAASRFETRSEKRERKLESGKYSWRKEPATTLLWSEVQTRLAALYCAMGGRRESAGCGFLESPVTMLDYSGHYNQCGEDQPLPNEFTKWKFIQGKDHEAEILRCEGYVRLYGTEEKTPFPIVPHQSEDVERLMWVKTNEREWSTICEFREALKWGLTYKNIEAVCFEVTDNERNHGLANFLRSFRVLKNEAEERCKNAGLDKDEDLQYHMFKLIGNSVIGKFLQAIEQDEEELQEFYGVFRYDKEKKRIFLRSGRPKPMHKEVSGFFCPEWSALILGRARAGLGRVFNVAGPNLITGHTDSLVFLKNEALKRKLKEETKDYGILGDKWDADGFWILRSAFYVALQKKEDGTWAVKLTEAEKPEDRQPITAHHAVAKRCRSEFLKKVLEAINTKGQSWVKPTILKSSSLAKPAMERLYGIPVGSDYIRESEVKLKWDFKRVLTSGFNVEKDCFSKWSDYCHPYTRAKDSFDEEKEVVHRERKIIPRRKLKKKRGRPKKWRDEKERKRVWWHTRRNSKPADQN